jgi:hypothetical protein
MANESKKQYVIEGKIVGTYESDTVDIDISLSDSELERVKGLIKSSDSKDLRCVIQEEFPELYEQINDQLVDAAYDYYRQEYDDYYAEGEDDEAGEIELTGEEYSCPIPKENLKMKKNMYHQQTFFRFSKTMTRNSSTNSELFSPHFIITMGTISRTTSIPNSRSPYGDGS